MCTSASSACWRSTICRATCSARSSTRNASPPTTSSIASSKSSGNRDMWTPFCDGSRSTVQSIVAAISFSWRPRPIRTAFCTPVTPARESPMRTSGGAGWRSSIWISCPIPMADDANFALLVSLACHDVRTPLATVHGFAKTLERTAELEAPADRYLEMISAASAQRAELLDELSLAARIEAGRYDPVLRDADTLTVAQGAVERLGEDRVQVSGEGAAVQTDEQALTRGVSALAQSALRHGGLDEVTIVVRRSEIDIAPVTPASAKVVLGEDLRDLGAAVAVRLVHPVARRASLGGRATTGG